MRTPLAILVVMLFIGIVIALTTFDYLHGGAVRSDAYSKLQPIGIKKATLGSSNITLFIADTDDERTNGLSGITDMAPHEGVLFQFDVAGQKVFWMKDMKFPLDFVYVNNNQVVELKENMLPSSYPNTITNFQPANIIIELNAGQIKQRNIKVGDVLELDSD